MEAFHWQFHPAAHAFRNIIDSGKYGNVISTDAMMTASKLLDQLLITILDFKLTFSI